MQYLRPLMLLLLVVCVVVVSGCSSGPTEKDIIGTWRNTKYDNLWMEFFADMTSTGGKWSITKDGQVKLENADGTVRTARLQEGKLIFAEFGDRGVFVKEGKQ